METSNRRHGSFVKFVLATALVAVAVLPFGCTKPTQRVVVYCAQDREFAEGPFAKFELDTGLRVLAKYDTEATKSVGLAAELETEASQPRCDLHWNNEILGTIRLASKGVYAVYTSSSAKDYPEWTRPQENNWQAFAGRARVLIVNTQLVKKDEYPKNLLDLTDAKWKNRLAMAKPQFGTTATQAACLWEVIGEDATKAFYRGLKSNNVSIVAGNRMVASAVAEGQAAIGLTDTDDALAEIQAGRPVAMIFPDRVGHASPARMGTLFIPNTVAIIKNGPNTLGARALADFLLKPEMEKTLAEAGGYQIPLNPLVKANLPVGMLTPAQTKPMAVDYTKAAELWDVVQAFLRDEFAR